MANTIGTAYIQIEPSTEGISGKLSSALVGESETAGKEAGSKFSSSLGSALKIGLGAVAGFTTAIAGAGTALANAASQTAEYGDNIDKTSQKLGLSAESFQKWDYVMNLAGTSMNNMGTGLKTLTNKLDDAKNGSKDSIQMFEALGLTLEDLETMSREDVFGAVITGFQGMADSTERAALANDLFGRSGQELTPLFNQSAEATQELMQNLENMGSVMSSEAVKASADFEDAMTTMQASLMGLKNGAMAELLPYFTEVITGITALLEGDMNTAFDSLMNGFSGITTGIQEKMPEIIESFTGIVQIIGELAPDLINALASGIIESIPVLLPTIINLIFELGRMIIDNLPSLVTAGLEVILELANGIAQSLPELIPTIVDVVFEVVEILLDNVDLIIDGAIALMMGLADGLIAAIPKITEKIPVIIVKLIEAFTQNAPKLIKASIQIMMAINNGMIDAIPELIKAIPQIIKALVTGFKSYFTEMSTVGNDIVEGIKQGISKAWNNLTSWLSSLCGNLISIVKKALKIGSPSKLFADEVGQWIPAGISVGIDDNLDTLDDSMLNMQSALSPSQMDVTSSYAIDYDTTSNDNGALYDLLSQYLPQIANMQVVMDTGATVGVLANPMNMALGKLASRGANR